MKTIIDKKFPYRPVNKNQSSSYEAQNNLIRNPNLTKKKRKTKIKKNASAQLL